MKKNELKFKQASFEDLEEMANIEQEFFKDYSRAFNKDFLEKWYLYNKDMFYVVKDYNDKVVAFTILTPVTKELYNQILLGEISDMYDFKEEDVLKKVQSDYYYISDICVSQKNTDKNYIKAVAFIIGGIVKILSENAIYVTTTPITKEGAKICEHIGFVEKTYSVYENQKYTICELIITDERKKRFSKLAKLVKEKK